MNKICSSTKFIALSTIDGWYTPSLFARTAELKKNCSSSLATCEKMQLIDARFYFRKRYFVMGLSFLGYLIMFILRINLSVCLVDMTSKKTIILANSSSIEEAEYHWTLVEKGIILSCFSWGFLVTPLTVTFVDKLGPASMYSLAMFVTGILTIASPALIQAGIHIYIVGRFFEGVSEGLAVSASYTIFANWVPPKERSRLINFVSLGVPMGTLVGYPMSGYISYLLNWRYVFYITGTISLIWSILWILTVRDSPSVDVLITKTEKTYLQSINEVSKKKADTKNKHIWRAMLTSKPVLVFLNETFVESWSVSFMMYCLPLFIKDVHDVSIDKIGIFASLPHICDIISRIVGCCFQDYLRTKGTMSKTKIHKMYIIFGQLSAVILFILAGFADNFFQCMIILCLFKIFFTMAELSYWVIPVDIAVEHSATIEALLITSMSVGYFLNPLAMSYMVPNHTHAEWNHYFWFLCIFNLWGLFVFSLYGSTEPYPWEKSGKNEEISGS